MKQKNHLYQNLKQNFGYQFTSKLEGMFTDIKISKESMERFKFYQNYSNKNL